MFDPRPNTQMQRSMWWRHGACLPESLFLLCHSEQHRNPGYISDSHCATMGTKSKPSSESFRIFILLATSWAAEPVHVHSFICTFCWHMLESAQPVTVAVSLAGFWWRLQSLWVAWSWRKAIYVCIYPFFPWRPADSSPCTLSSVCGDKKESNSSANRNPIQTKVESLLLIKSTCEKHWLDGLDTYRVQTTTL